MEIVFAYVGAAATKSVLLALIILGTATFFTPLHILHPGWMVAFMLLTAIAFSLFGFIIGLSTQISSSLPSSRRSLSRHSPSSAAPSIRSTCCRSRGGR